MMLLMEYHLQSEPGAKKISMTVTCQGRLHLLTTRMPHVEKSITRQNLIFKFTPLPGNQVRIHIYEKYPIFKSAVNYPGDQLTHYFEAFP